MNTGKRHSGELREFHTMFSNNSFSGELYLVKFVNDDTLYSGIPIARSRSMTDASETFSFNVIEPEAESGVYEMPFQDIEFAVRKM